MSEKSDATKLLEVKNICKSFYGNKVLDDVSFDLKYGEVLGLIGQNGAGKSTLVKILTGVYRLDSGNVKIEGEAVDLFDINIANEKGIALVFQELSITLNMTVAENIFIKNEPTKAFGLVDRKRLNEKAQDLISRFDVNIKADDMVSKLSIGERQIVEILKAIAKKPKVLILDEPTSSLEEAEINILYNFIEELIKNNLSIIYISHHMSEIFRIVDRVLVLRDGKQVGMFNRDETNMNDLIKIMINQDIVAHFGGSNDKNVSSETIFETKNLTKKSRFKDINITVNKGEILGITGIVGCGKSELCQSIYGVTRTDEGEMYLEGKKVSINNPSDAKKRGIIFLPQNRKLEGLFLDDSVANNSIVCILPKVSNRGFLDKKKITDITKKYVNKLGIKIHAHSQQIRFLSGGNQQKVLVTKCIAAEPKILIAMDPTRGIDIGAKADIHKILHELAQKGLAIIMVTAELDELMNMCDRIAVMNDGILIKTFSRKQFDIGQLLLAMHQSIN